MWAHLPLPPFRPAVGSAHVLISLPLFHHTVTLAVALFAAPFFSTPAAPERRPCSPLPPPAPVFHQLTQLLPSPVNLSFIRQLHAGGCKGGGSGRRRVTTHAHLPCSGVVALRCSDIQFGGRGLQRTPNRCFAVGLNWALGILLAQHMLCCAPSLAWREEPGQPRGAIPRLPTPHILRFRGPRQHTVTQAPTRFTMFALTPLRAFGAALLVQVRITRLLGPLAGSRPPGCCRLKSSASQLPPRRRRSHRTRIPSLAPPPQIALAVAIPIIVSTKLSPDGSCLLNTSGNTCL